MKKIRLILINYISEFSDQLLIELNKTKRIDYLLLIDVKKPTIKTNFKIDFLNANNLHNGEYNLNLGKINYPTVDFFKENYELESFIMDMLMRGEKASKQYQNAERLINKKSYNLIFSNGVLSYENRRIIYKKHIKFWQNIIEKKKINAYFNISTPHIIYDFIPYYLCKKKKIYTFFSEMGRYFGLRIPRESFLDDFKELKKKISYLRKKNSDTTKIILSNSGEFYFNRMKNKNPFPGYFNKKIQNSQGFPEQNKENISRFLIRIIKNFILNKNNFLYEISKRKIISSFKTKTDFLKNYYENISLSISDISKVGKFIFYPLHYQPEATTNPLGWHYHDQFYLANKICELAQSLNLNVLIKEHPSQKAIGRSVEFYSELMNNKNLFFVKSNVNQFELINKSKAVAVCTSTTGWEAIFKGKPVLSFGDSYLKLAPGVLDLSENFDKKKVTNFLKKFNAATDYEIKTFFKAAEETSFKAFFPEDKEFLFGQDKITIQECISSYINYFLKRLDVQKI